MSEPQRYRRAADRQAGSDAGFEGILRLLFVGVLVAIVGGFGWWYWRQLTGVGVVRDSAPNFTPDSKYVVFSSEVDGQSELVQTDLTGRERNQITRLASNEGGPAYSPDGALIAFETDRDGNFEIYIMQANSESAKPLTRHPARDLAPSWSPDGRTIVFMSDRDNPEFDVYRMDSEGKNVERLTTGGSTRFPQYSPDGAHIAMHIGRDVQVLNLKTRTFKRLTHEPMNGMHPSWSADGSQIAFMSWRNGRTEIFTAKATGHDPELLVSMPSGDAVDPRWSPDGKYIAFVHLPDGGASTSQASSRQRVVYIVDVKTDRMTRLSR